MLCTAVEVILPTRRPLGQGVMDLGSSRARETNYVHTQA